MGDVYLAEDPQIERQLAIKTVRVADGRPAEVEDRKRRLLREAKAAGRMIHPHVITLFDAGEAEGVLYLAFEFVDGSDLAQRLETKPPLQLREVLRIVREAAEALDFAHQHGIVHRDIKPSNILLDRHGRVKVADFGIARLAGQATELTMTGSVVGSPHYLSPEQVRGEELDGRSDLFSLGVVLYELLGHRRPFDGDTLTTLVYQILNQEPKPLPALAPGLAPHLEPLIARLMAKDRERRFSTAGAAAEEIRRLEASLPADLLAMPASLEPADPDATSLLTSGPGSGAKRPVSVSSADQPTALLASPPTLAAPAPAAARRSATGPLLLAGFALLILAVVGFAAWNLFGRKLLERKTTSVARHDPTTSASPSAATTTTGAQAPGVSDKAVAPPVPSAPPAEERRDPATEAPARPASPTAIPSIPSPNAPEVVAKRAPSSQVAPPLPSPPVSRPPASRPAPPEPPPAAEPEPEPPAEDLPKPAAEPKPAVHREMTTGLSLTFQVKPEDAFLRLRELGETRSTPIGQASDYTGKGREGRPYRLPSAGDFVLSLRKEGLDNYDILIHAVEGRGQTPVVVDMAARTSAAASSSLAVREGITLRGEPDTARVLVDGVDRGMARDFAGGIGGRKVLLLAPGLRRVTVTAPGLGSQIFEVQVSPAASKERETLRFKLP